jgi:hypothetical protein
VIRHAGIVSWRGPARAAFRGVPGSGW